MRPRRQFDINYLLDIEVHPKGGFFGLNMSVEGKTSDVIELVQSADTFIAQVNALSPNGQPLVTIETIEREFEDPGEPTDTYYYVAENVRVATISDRAIGALLHALNLATSANGELSEDKSAMEAQILLRAKTPMRTTAKDTPHHPFGLLSIALKVGLLTPDTLPTAIQLVSTARSGPLNTSENIAALTTNALRRITRTQNP